jgi:hypothetical protein
VSPYRDAPARSAPPASFRRLLLAVLRRLPLRLWARTRRRQAVALALVAQAEAVRLRHMLRGRKGRELLERVFRA